MNYIEERDENLEKLSRNLERAVNSLRAYVRENDANISRVVRAKMCWHYRILIAFNRFIRKYMRETAKYSVEIGGKTLEMDWRNMTQAEIAAAFKEDGEDDEDE